MDLHDELIDADRSRATRLDRVERLLDRWLDHYEEALEEAKPDANKTTELGGVFSIIKRILEIELLQLRLNALEGANEPERTKVNRNVFGEGVFETDEGGENG